MHLSARRPERVEAFLDFLAGPCRDAERLVLLGDVFDEWLGDDDDREPHPRTVDALRALTASGVAVDFCYGNHDFLVGDKFFAATGCQPLADGAVIDVHGTAVTVLHGDRLCTRDRDYQRWRAEFTDPDRQTAFLALPFAVRVEKAAAIRHGSMQATRLKPEDIMDVAPETVEAEMSSLGVLHMVHGHTHRPAVHALSLPHGSGRRIVLGDWYDDEQVLAWDVDGPRLGAVSALFPG